MELKEIREKYEIVDLFCKLAEIPSPSLEEQKVADFIKEYCAENNLKFQQDNYGNVIIKVDATDCSKQPLLLSAHMDVIGDDSPVEIYLDGDLLRAKGRTLGADDKIGVANALYLAKKITETPEESHGGLEIVFTRDEESGMSGIRNLDFSKINSKYVLVLDSDSLGQLMTAGASYTQVKITVKSVKGGHSGIDIADTSRKNAAKLIAELLAQMPQGVFYSKDNQVITSCNLGGIKAGDVNVTNIINPEACASYSIRSSSREMEEALKNVMTECIKKFNKHYENLASAEIVFEEHLPPFEEVKDEYIPILFETVAKKLGITPEISSFHAGAETHIYANNINSKGEKFAPYLVGLANVCSMHSSDENVEYNSILQGAKLLKATFDVYNS